MILKKTASVIGLDIGSRYIKAAEILKTGAGYTLKRFGMSSIEPNAIEEGTIKDPDHVAATIKTLLSENKFKNKNIATSIGGYSVIVKKINVQNMPESQLQESIQFEAEQYIPFDINDVNLDFQILGENENNPTQMNVLLVAARKDMIEEYVHLIEMAGLNPAIVDVDAFALQNIYELNYPVENQNVALIDIGAGKTSLNILKGNSSEFIRDISFGCNQVNNQIMNTFNCSFEESETLKFGKASDNRTAEEVNEIILSVISDWSREIRRAFDFYYSSNPDDQIQRIILSGGGTHIKELHRILTDETGSEVTILNPLANISVGEISIGSKNITAIAPQASICFGLALRRMDDK
ncbi:MAG: type IV pilus assembly protein PilM, partial [Thermodesulfobacteriota bacterium]